MKTKKFFLFLMFTFVGIHLVFAQNITITKRYKIDDNKIRGYYPILSTNGDKLLFTSDSYKGLSLYDFNTKTVIKITDEEGAGYEPIFDESESKIFYRKTSYQNNRKFEAIESFDLNTKQKKEMISPQRTVRQLQPYHKGLLVSVDRKLLKATFGKVQQEIPVYVCSEDLKLVIYKNRNRQELNPIAGEDVSYIWVSLSPDKTKILFTATTKGTFVCDLNGKIIASLGYLNAPVWYDNHFVVGMQDKDDGHFITESKIIMMPLKFDKKHILSLPNEIAMYPSASAKAKKVAYNTIDGIIQIVELDIK